MCPPLINQYCTLLKYHLCVTIKNTVKPEITKKYNKTRNLCVTIKNTVKPGTTKEYSKTRNKQQVRKQKTRK